jgi:RNA recognition motif-containing protein
MSTRLYVGNLPFKITDSELQDLFATHGPVTKVDMIMDKFTGRPRGFAFVTMDTPVAAEGAIKALHGKSLDGRAITVNIARPREERPSEGGGFRGEHREPRREYRDRP